MKPDAKPSSRPAALLAIAAAGVLLVSGASAQPQPGTPGAPGAPNDVAPPVPTAPNKVSTNYPALIEAFFLGALVIGVNLIPSKRGHQD